MSKALKEEEEEVEIHGDVFEIIFSHVPLVDLASASHVTRCWRGAVSSSLHHRNPLKTWLILHTQATRFPHATTSHAYDPRSHIWIRISGPSIKYISALKSSHSNFLYMLSPSKLSFSLDPLNSYWCTVDPPRVWRTDPIVSHVGDYVVIAGGVCYFEDDSLAVEVYDLRTRGWCTCESMPVKLKDSAAASWLSIATANEKLIVVDKQSGITHWFDPITKSWSDSFVLNPGQPVSSYHIGCSDNGLILVGVFRNKEVETVKIWRVGENDFSCEEIGEMPTEFVIKLKGSYENSTIDIRVAGNIMYVYNTWAAEEVVGCEMMNCGGCRWWSMMNVVAREGMIGQKWVFSCCEVGVVDLRRVMSMRKWKFEVVQ